MVVEEVVVLAVLLPVVVVSGVAVVLDIKLSVAAAASAADVAQGH